MPDIPPWRTICFVATAVFGIGLPVHGEAIWEVTPYRLRVWITCQQRPEFDETFIRELGRGIKRRSESVVGAVWRVEVCAAPPELASASMACEDVAVDVLCAAAPDVLQRDKLVLLVVGRGVAEYSIDAREFDVATQQWGIPVRHSAGHISVVPDAAVRSLADSFCPLGRLESVAGQTARVVLKAAALAGTSSPAWLGKGALLQPVARRNDRLGRPVTGGIHVVPWTLLEVCDNDSGVLKCTIHSGLRRALRGRSSYRTKRLALAVRPGQQPTTLSFTSRLDSGKPLAGYQVLARTAADTPLQILGETSSTGRIVVPPQESPLQLLYVNSGTRLLARLPIVSGRGRQLSVALPDDEPRLWAESFLAGVDDRLTDVTVRRAFLAAKIRASIAAGDLADAAEIFDAYRLLDNKIQFSDALQQERARLVVEDSDLEREIDRLFGNAREKITKYLDPDAERRLTAELDRAKSEATRPAERLPDQTQQDEHE